jgi:hypothetical protein
MKDCKCKDEYHYECNLGKGSHKMRDVSNWFIVTTSDPYRAPETLKFYLHGITPDNGHNIRTSSVVDIVDGVVHTRSGSQYKLAGESITPTDMPDYLIMINPDRVKKIIDSRK